MFLLTFVVVVIIIVRRRLELKLKLILFCEIIQRLSKFNKFFFFLNWNEKNRDRKKGIKVVLTEKLMHFIEEIQTDRKTNVVLSSYCEFELILSKSLVQLNKNWMFLFLNWIQYHGRAPIPCLIHWQCPFSRLIDYKIKSFVYSYNSWYEYNVTPL